MSSPTTIPSSYLNEGYDNSSSSSSDEKNSQPERQEQDLSDFRNSIYNSKNVLICESDIRNIFTLLNIRDIEIFNVATYQRAFVHKSYSLHNSSALFTTSSGGIPSSSQSVASFMTAPPNVVPLQSQSNERDEFFGDGFLDCIIAKYLYERYDDQNEGFLTRTRTKLVNGQILSKLTERLGLQRFVLMSKHVEENCAGRALTSIMGDLLEAFISAIYQDQYMYIEHKLQVDELTRGLMALKTKQNEEEINRLIKIAQDKHRDISPSGFAFHKTEMFVVKLIEKFVDFDELVMNETNYKDILLKHFQKKYKGAPEYKEISVEGPPHKRTFKISVHHIIGDEFLGIGEGKTKKDAQQIAAKNALEKLGIEAKYV